MDNILALARLSRMRDEYLVKANNLDSMYFLGLDNFDVHHLQWECWSIRRDAFKMLAEIYDAGMDDRILTARAADFGWRFDQLDKASPTRQLLKPDDNSDLADPKKPGGPSDYSDPSPVNAEHVMNLMRSNFPEDAIAWVMRARWVGPVNIPWERIDKDDIDSWAASHQASAVNRFARDIKAGTGHTNPSVLIQDNDSPKAIIIDGHHRAMAHHKLGQDVLAYLGQIDPGDRMAAEETHSKQVHSGTSPENR